MKQLAVKLILFFLLILTLLKLLDIYYTRYILAHRNVCEKPDWAMAHTGQNYDYAVLGNSRVYNMLDVPALDSLTGKNGINLGFTGSNYAEMYLQLDQFIRNKNTIKNLIIEVDLMSMNAKKVNFKFRSYIYMHLLSDSLVSNIYKDNVPLYRYCMWKYIPFVRYMEFSNRFVFYKILKGGFECTAFEELDSSKGGVFFYGQKFQKKMSKHYWTVDETDLKYFEKIIVLAKENNMTITLYTAPIYANYLKAQLNYKAVMQRAKDIAIRESIRYIDFSKPEDPMCMNRDNFFDNTHLNDRGVKKFSLSLADSIKPLLK